MNVAILTPAADQDLYIRIWSDWYQQLEQALAGVGLKASPHSWTEPLPRSFDAVLPMIAVPSVLGMMLGARIGARLLDVLRGAVIRRLVIGVLLFRPQGLFGAKA